MAKNYVPITIAHAVNSFFWAAVAASLTAVVPLLLFAAGEFESAATFSPLTKVMHFFMMMGYMFVIGFILVAVIACIPFTLGVVVANFFKTSHWLYFVGGATVTAFFAIPVLVFIPNFEIQGATEPTFWKQFWNTARFILPAGTIAGLVCWRYLRKHVWRCTSAPQSA